MLICMKSSYSCSKPAPASWTGGRALDLMSLYGSVNDRSALRPCERSFLQLDARYCWTTLRSGVNYCRQRR